MVKRWPGFLLWLWIFLLCAAPVEGQSDRLRPTGYNLLYGDDKDGRRRLDVYVPENAEGPFPVLLYFHGYGGDKSDVGGLTLPDIAARAGYATVAVNYSILLPDGYLDAYCALSWVQTLGAEYGLDPARVVTLGVSWGGLPATMLAAQEQPDVFPLNCPHPAPDPEAIIGAISVAGVLAGSADGLRGFTADAELWADPDLTALLEATPPEDWLTLDLPIETLTALAWWPMVWIDDSEPPHLLIHGAGDSSIPYWQSYDYARILTRNRTTVTVIVDRIAGHVPGPAVFEGEMRAFLERAAHE